MPDALDLAADAALRSLEAAGVQGAVSVGITDHWSVTVRGGSAEQVSSAAARGVRVTAWAAGNRTAAVTSGDLDPTAVGRLAAQAASLAAATDPDPYGGLPPIERCGNAAGDLDLDDAAGFAGFAIDQGVALVAEAERAALAADGRVTATHRSSCNARRGTGVYATTHGIRNRESSSRLGYHVLAVATIGDEKQQGAYGTSARHRADLKPAAVVGGEAGARAVRFAGWKRPPTGALPVLLHHEVAGDLLDIISDAAWGGAVFRGATFLAEAAGTAIASPLITVTDEPLLRRGLGSRRSDGEGVRSAPFTLVDAGTLTGFLTDGYAARRLKRPYTGHAGGTSNLILRPGADSFAALLGKLGTGLLAMELSGHGLDLAGGTWSKGVAGFWVEGGKISHPVREGTLACDLRTVLHGIRAVGDDPEQQTTVSSPSLLVDGFTVAGD
jgi:PmbA protein